MKTFLILFAIASSLPADAQRVRENVRQRAEITQEREGAAPRKVVEKAKRVRQEKKVNSFRKE